MAGYIVTWDVNSKDAAQRARVRRFIDGRAEVVDGRNHKYPGFAEQEGVRYLGQSTLFVSKERLDALRKFLMANDVIHGVTEAWIGSNLA